MVEEKKEKKTSEDSSKAQEVKQVSENSETNAQINQQVETAKYSGFWVRGAALFIDSLIIGVAMSIIFVPIAVGVGLVVGMIDNAFVTFIMNMFMLLLSLAMSWGYFIFMTYKYQATLGKMAVGARVVSEDGKNLTLGNVVLRETVGKIISAIIFYIGYIMAGFTSKKQALHDMMAHSTVVYKDSKEGANKIVVAIVYVVWGLLMFASIIFSFVFVAFVMTAIAGIMHVSNSANNIQDNYTNMPMMEYIEDNEMILDEMDEQQGAQMIEQILQDLDLEEYDVNTEM